MESDESNKTVETFLLAVPVVLVGMMIGTFVAAVDQLGEQVGLLVGFATYWAICGSLAAVFLDGDDVAQLWKGFKPTPQWEKWLYWVIVWVPAIGSVFTVFLAFVSETPGGIIALAGLFALVNAPIEELFWRGIYPVHFPDSVVRGYLYPTICFGLWHFAIYLSSGNPLQGGVATLVGGSLVMGLLWGWVAWRRGHLVPPVLAHLATNFFAFTGYLSVLT